jgi:nitronate monooxygenase
MQKETLPTIIQGGMGIGVSSVELARTISIHGYLGVVSGTAVATTLVRRLQVTKGRKKIVEAISAFPFKTIGNKVLEKYKPNPKNIIGKNRFKPLEMPTLDQSTDLTELIVLANFVEVYLAKKGHKGIIGINLLEKIQLPTLPSIYGAMLADVDYLLMGAGIPKYIPNVLNAFSKNQTASMPVKVTGDHDAYMHTFDPVAFANNEPLPKLNRPKFLAIIASTTLALHLYKNEETRPDGFIVEAPIAGGHNAPPRGKLTTNDLGEPIYGIKDEVDLEKLKTLELPFWLAGGYGHFEAYTKALSQGATGIQVGTAFAFSKESGMKISLKERIIDSLKKGMTKVKTDLLASPTGFPFKVVELSNTTGEEKTYKARKRICDIGYLREPYRKENGEIGYRCPSEPEAAYIKKGGKLEDTIGRKCLCNGLMSTTGFSQERSNGQIEAPIVTAGDDLNYILKYLKPGKRLYSAIDVLKEILRSQYKPLNLTIK